MIVDVDTSDKADRKYRKKKKEVRLWCTYAEPLPHIGGIFRVKRGEFGSLGLLQVRTALLILCLWL
jgi:hypothetical protein